MYKLNRKMPIWVNLMIINLISISFIIIYLSNKTLAYEMKINNRVSLFVKEKKKIDEYYREKIHNTNIESGRVIKIDPIKFELKLVNRQKIKSIDYAMKFMDESINTYIEGYILLLDGRKVANIYDENTFVNVKERLIKYYLNKHNLDKSQVNWSKIKEKVEFKKAVINSNDLLSEEDLYNFIINNNNKNDVIATVEIVARKIFLENYEGKKVQVMASINRSKLSENYDKKIFKKEIVNEITYNNEKYIGMRNVYSKILKPSLSEVQGNELFYLNNPSNNNTITSQFGIRWGGEKHHGIDIAGNVGDPIFAAESGVASLVSYNNVYGNYIKINHGKGVETLYGHCDTLLIKEGEYVMKGQTIGKIGNTGRSTGPHLHFEVRINGMADNPLNYVTY